MAGSQNLSSIKAPVDLLINSEEEVRTKFISFSNLTIKIMDPLQVNPAAWQNHEVIFNDDEFSGVWGQYKGNYCLGIRWNGDTADERGYPGHGPYPPWFVVPEYLTLSVS